MNEFESELVTTSIIDGIVLLKFQKGTILDLDAVKEAIALREKFATDEHQYVLCDITNVKNVTAEARKYGSKHGHNQIYACAVVINSCVTKFIFTSYLKFSKPDFPFAFFTCKEKALEWLKEIKAKNTKSNSV